MTKLDVLVNMRQLLDNPRRWTKGANARQADGFNTSVNDPRACKWCLHGALMREADKMHDELESQHEIAMLIAQHIRPYSLIVFNDFDGTTHEDVLNLLDTTIAEYKASLL